MGGFFYADKRAISDFENTRIKTRKQFEYSGFDKPIELDTDSYVIDYYPKIDCLASNYVTFGDGNFIFAVGTFIYREHIGADALRLFYNQTDYLGELRGSRGHFLIVLRKAGQTLLFKDPIGSYELFLTRDGSSITTSFLAATAASGHCTINAQETYEYVFNGVSLGDATIFAEIRRLGLFERMILEPTPSILSQEVVLVPEEDRKSSDAILEQNLSGLLEYATTLTRLFGDNIKVALSGGYDSRFLLALFRRSGVTPKLFVYGRSGDEDVLTAKRIADAEGIPLQHVDKDLLKQATPESFAEILERNFFREDALPNGGIFTNGAELVARSWRSENGALHVNGGGGEVFRNFFNLPKRKRLTPRQFVWVFYSQFDPAQCTEAFSADVHDEKVAAKVAAVFGRSVDVLSRRQIESLYSYFRCRSWFGRENSVNSRWGYSILPFFDHQTVSQALRIPVRYKDFGNFESCLIRRADPALAQYDSNYGFNFTRDAPPSAVLAAWLTHLRPPWLRRRTFRLKSRLEKRPGRPNLLSEPYLEQVIDTAFPYMSRYFHLDRVTSELQFARICTLEYLFQYVSAQSV